MSKINYSLLTKKAKSYLEDTEFIENLFLMPKILEFLNQLYIPFNIQYLNRNTYIPIEESLKIVKEFLKSIDPKLEQIFLNILTFDSKSIIFVNIRNTIEELEFNENIKLTDSDKERIISERINKSYTNNNGNTVIDYSNKIDDVFTIIHEFIHKLYNNPNSDLWNITASEVTPITMEFILSDYLIKNNIYATESKKYLLDRFRYIINESFLTKFNLMLTNLYLKDGFINENNLKEEILNIEDDKVRNAFSDKYIEAYFDIIKDGYKVTDAFAYEFALFMAPFLKNLFLKKSNNINRILEIERRTNMGYNLDEIFKISGLNLFKYSNINQDLKLFEIKRLNKKDLGVAFLKEYQKYIEYYNEFVKNNKIKKR